MSKATENKTSKYYVVNLDINRIFWIVAISLFIINISFLIGYWLGNKIDYSDIQNSNEWTGIENLDTEEIQKFSNITEIKNITENAINSSQNGKDHSNNTIGGTLLDKNKDTIDTVDTEKKIENRKESKNDANNEKVNENTKEKIRKKENKPVATTKSKKKYSVQIASYKIKNNAFSSRKQLYKKGKKTHLVIKNKNGKKIYLLRLGPFTSYSKAKKEKEQIKNTFKDSFIIKN